MRRRPRATQRLAACLSVLVLALPIGIGSAQTAASTAGERVPASEAITEVLQAVQSHPSLQAAAASVAAAEARLRGAYQPVELQVDASAARLVIENDTPEGIGQPSPQVSVQAVAHPFLYGDLADRAVQLETELLRARLAFREVAAQLETQAIDALAGVLLAERGVSVAERAADLTRAVADATAQRAARGAARSSDVARAEQQSARAAAEVTTAVERLELARIALAALTGGLDTSRDMHQNPELPAGASALPQLSLVDGEAPSVTRAEWDATLAQVGLAASHRNLLPIAQASYTWNLSEDRGSVSVGLESRTLSPSLSYRTSSDTSDRGTGAMGPAFADLAPMQLEPSAPRVAGQLAIGVSLTLSPERFHAIDASEARLEAARAGVEAARLRAATNRRSLLLAVASAERLVQLAEADLDLARRDRDDVAERVELGLATTIELQESDLTVARSELELLRTQHTLLRSQLDIYVNAAIPVSEVLP